MVAGGVIQFQRRCTMAKIPAGVDPRYPQMGVLFGATGGPAERKPLQGLFHPASAGFIPGCRIISVSLYDIDADGFRAAARKALDEFSARKVTDADWNTFAACLGYVPLSAGAEALKAAVNKAELAFTGECRRLHYLSVPPSAALSAVCMLGEAKLVERSRIIMEMPFGTDPQSAVSLNTKLHEVFDEERMSASTTFWARSRCRTFLRFVLPMVCSNRSGTATSSTTRRSTCPKRWAWASAPRSTSRPARTETWW